MKQEVEISSDRRQIFLDKLMDALSDECVTYMLDRVEQDPGFVDVIADTIAETVYEKPAARPRVVIIGHIGHIDSVGLLDLLFAHSSNVILMGSGSMHDDTIPHSLEAGFPTIVPFVIRESYFDEIPLGVVIKEEGRFFFPRNYFDVYGSLARERKLQSNLKSRLPAPRSRRQLFHRKIPC